MNLIPIIALAVTILAVAGGVYFLFRTLGSLTRGEKERQRLLAVGVPAHAHVLQVSMGNLTVTTGVHRQIQVELSVEVHRPGAPPYPARIKSLVSELQIPQVQPGAWLGICVDPADPQNVAIEALGVPPPGTGSDPSAGADMRRAYRARAGGTPMTGFQIPLGSKIGGGIALVCAALGIGAAIYTSIGSVGGSQGDTCKKAAACCRKLTPSSAACTSYLHMNGGDRERLCGNALESFQHMGCK